jgi:hypothetical protein
MVDRKSLNVPGDASLRTAQQHRATMNWHGEQEIGGSGGRCASAS